MNGKKEGKKTKKILWDFEKYIKIFCCTMWQTKNKPSKIKDEYSFLAYILMMDRFKKKKEK